MEDSLSTALTLLAVGMITVFTILTLIVVIGNLLIIIVNRFFPDEPSTTSSRSGVDKSSDPRVLAAIITSVEVITRGKGRVTSIDKD